MRWPSGVSVDRLGSRIVKAGEAAACGATVVSWDRKQRGGKYYYRSRRINGRSVKVYLGCGAAAQLAARLDERERQDRRAEREAFLAEQVRLAVADVVLSDARDLVGLLVRAALILSGFHLHRGSEWRRRREHATHGR